MESFDEQLAIASVYAKALFELANSDQSVDAVRTELDELKRLVTDDVAFANFMSSAAIDADKRSASLDTIFRGKLSDKTLNTLQVMNRHERGGLLVALQHAFVEIENAANNQIACVAKTALELDDAQKQAVQDVAAKVTGKQPLLTFEVDASILGGLVLEMGGWRYDNSLQRQLIEMKKRLFERGDRGLPVGVASE